MAVATISIAANAGQGGTTQAPVFMSATPPAVPANGSLWWNSETGRLHVYYVDANSQAWVQIGI